jgi:excisionase family DNA binding protein
MNKIEPRGERSSSPSTGVRPVHLLSVEDVASILQLRPSTIRAYAERGILPCVLVGNRLRFKPSDVDLWIERRYRKGAK